MLRRQPSGAADARSRPGEPKVLLHTPVISLQSSAHYI